MKTEDLSPIYFHADLSAARAQRAFFLCLAGSLTALILLATLQAIELDPPKWDRELAAVQLVLLLFSLGLTVYLLVKEPQREWFGTRALAESIKTVCWRYAMRAEPYAGADEKARKLFGENLIKIIRENEVSQAVVAESNAPLLTSAMNQTRGLPLDKRVEVYLADRIEDQLSWYQKKARYNKTQSLRWFSAIIFLHALAILFAIGKLLGLATHFWPTDAIAAAASATLAWVQARRFQDLSASYSQTFFEIGLLKEGIALATGEESFSDFVSDAENAFSREHTQWQARRDVA